eukprot:Rhum_TRINITY_DN19394_c0_g1::Rhum_TRINITY_DN19394_c0_g1_i1::g.169931::m.169931
MCGGSVARYLELAKRSGQTQFFHTQELLFMEVSLDAETTSATADGVSVVRRRAVVVPLGVTPRGALQMAEKVVPGPLVPHHFDITALNRRIHEVLQSTRIPLDEIQGLFVYFPTPMGVLPPETQAEEAL